MENREEFWREKNDSQIREKNRGELVRKRKASFGGEDEEEEGRIWREAAWRKRERSESSSAGGMEGRLLGGERRKRRGREMRTRRQDSAMADLGEEAIAAMQRERIIHKKEKRWRFSSALKS